MRTQLKDRCARGGGQWARPPDTAPTSPRLEPAHAPRPLRHGPLLGARGGESWTASRVSATRKGSGGKGMDGQGGPQTVAWGCVDAPTGVLPRFYRGILWVHCENRMLLTGSKAFTKGVFRTLTPLQGQIRREYQWVRSVSGKLQFTKLIFRTLTCTCLEGAPEGVLEGASRYTQ